MQITKDTKVSELLDRYPYLLEFLAAYRPALAKLRNPVLRSTLARVATIDSAAAMGGVSGDELVAAVRAEVTAHGSPPGDGTPEEIRARQQETLKHIIRDLHSGADIDSLKGRFAVLSEQVGPGEIAALEQALISEGMPAEEIQRLCDLHVDVFKEALDAGDLEPRSVPAGHPVDTFRKENLAASEVVRDARCVLEPLVDGRPEEVDLGRVREVLARLAEIDKHYLRKENGLFPFLEKHGVSGPSQVMWGIHDEIRVGLKRLRKAADEGDRTTLAEDGPAVLSMIDDMVYKEEKILFPVALDTLDVGEWERVREAEPAIGYAWVEGATRYEPGVVPAAKGPVTPGLLPLTTGALTAYQVDLMLRTLPLDVTFVDELDTVRFYSEGDRVFPRSPAVIGRQVQQCHPPKSVHIVSRILKAFREGERDAAEFWLELSGRFVHIRYFAVRDSDGRYRGCVETVQDATALRGLTGERRLLDWTVEGEGVG